MSLNFTKLNAASFAKQFLALLLAAAYLSACSASTGWDATDDALGDSIRVSYGAGDPKNYHYLVASARHVSAEVFTQGQCAGAFDINALTPWPRRVGDDHEVQVLKDYLEGLPAKLVTQGIGSLLGRGPSAACRASLERTLNSGTSTEMGLTFDGNKSRVSVVRGRPLLWTNDLLMLQDHDSVVFIGLALMSYKELRQNVSFSTHRTLQTGNASNISGVSFSRSLIGYSKTLPNLTGSEFGDPATLTLIAVLAAVAIFLLAIAYLYLFRPGENGAIPQLRLPQNVAPLVGYASSLNPQPNQNPDPKARVTVVPVPVRPSPMPTEEEKTPCRDFRGGDAIWMGPVLATSPSPPIYSPSDVRYHYVRYPKADIAFDPSRLKRVVLARHGQSIANRWGIFQGTGESAMVTQDLIDAINRDPKRPREAFPYQIGDLIAFTLTNKGLQDAQELAYFLRRDLDGRPVTTVFSSSSARAYQTATPVAAAFVGSLPTIMPDLLEASAPLWTGLHGDQQLRGHDPQHALWLANPYAYPPPQGESATQLIQRGDRALSQLIASIGVGQTVIAVSHKGFLLWIGERFMGTRLGVPDALLAKEAGGVSEHWNVLLTNAGWLELFAYEGRIVLCDRNGAPAYSGFYIPPGEEITHDDNL